MTLDTPDLSLESERARLFIEARLIAERLVAYTALINQWNAIEEGHEDARQ